MATKKCGYCLGRGQTTHGLCPICKGKGSVNVREPARECGNCQGRGQTIHGMCPVCKGKGSVTV
jgi:DnaJ-class molecular chaperone